MIHRSLSLQVMEITDGKGVKCVIDGIGANTWELSLASLGLRGKIGSNLVMPRSGSTVQRATTPLSHHPTPHPTPHTPTPSNPTLGICIFFGNASGPVPPVNPLKLIGKSNFICRPKLLDYTASREELLWRSSEVFGWYDEG